MMKQIYRLLWVSLTAGLLAGCGSLEWDGSSVFGNPLSGSQQPKSQAYAPLPPATADTKYAVVNYGETVSQVAARHGVDANALAAANNMSPFAQLTQGQYLRLPEGSIVADATGAVNDAQNQLEEKTQELQTVKEQATAVAKNPVTPAATAPVAAAQTTAKKGYVWPTQGQVTSNYSSSSSGITISAPRSAPVVAAKEGTVVHSGNVSGYGNTVILKHPDGMVSVYGYNDSLLVKKGDTVGRGQVISRVGSSGSATSPSLRFELRKGKTPVNPNEYLGQ